MLTVKCELRTVNYLFHGKYNFMFFRKKIKPQIMITIPEPCSEVWSEMRVVDDCHRHCEACERTLTDFAQMNDDELLLFFKNTQGKICGRFRKDQLNRPLTPIPEKTSKATWWKAAALLPLTLFSKSTSAQQVVSDTTKQEQLGPVADVAEPDSIVPFVVDWGHGNDSTLPYKWNWEDIPGVQLRYEVTGGVPFIITTTELCITGWTIPFDTASPPQPKTKSELGIKATASQPPVKKSDAPKSAQVGWNFQAIVPDSTKNK